MPDKIDDSWYELRTLCFAQQFSEAALLLQKDPSLRDRRNTMGETVLHYLAVENQIEAVKWLHSKGFSLDVHHKSEVPLFFEVALLNYHDLMRWFTMHLDVLKLRDSEDQDVFQYLEDFRKKKPATFLRSLIEEN